MRYPIEDLRRIRRKLRISQVLLAKLVGVSTVTVYLWEHGTSRPTATNLATLQSVLYEIEQGVAKCPHGHALGADYDQKESCRLCAYVADCRKQRARGLTPGR